MSITNSVNILKWFTIQFLFIFMPELYQFLNNYKRKTIILLLVPQLLQISHSKSCQDQIQSPFLLSSVLYRCRSFPHTQIKLIFPLSGSISFHNKNQFSVTLSSTVKVNSPHADIHIQISPSVTQHYLVHVPSASIQPRIKSLWIDLVYSAKQH